jgi:hypothetical protein
MIIGLLFVITTINYMDRNLLGVLKPTIQGDLHFSETDYGNIVFAFSMAYAAGYASMGAFSDRVGVRVGLAVAAMIWCAASAAHGLVTSVAGFTAARIALGLGEGGRDVADRQRRRGRSGKSVQGVSLRQQSGICDGFAGDPRVRRPSDGRIGAERTQSYPVSCSSRKRLGPRLVILLSNGETVPRPELS